MAFGFKTFLDRIGDHAFATGDAHQDRNGHQAGLAPDQIPDPKDPDSPNCFVVDGMAYVAETWPEAAWAAVHDLHDYDSDGDGREDEHANTLRGIPVTPEAYHAIVGTEEFRDHWREAQAAYPDHEFGEPEPGVQFAYTADGELIEGNGTFDYASPLTDSLGDHLRLDVAPHMENPDYSPVDSGSHQDLSDLTSQSSQANTWPCSQGEYVGGGPSGDGRWPEYDHDWGGDAALDGGYDDGGHDDGGYDD